MLIRMTVEPIMAKKPVELVKPNGLRNRVVERRRMLGSELAPNPGKLANAP